MNAERYSAVTESTTSLESPDNKNHTQFVTEDRKGADVCSQPQSQGDLAHALNEAELRRFIDTIPALAWSSHPDGSVDFVNQRWTVYTGLSPEESYGWGWKTAIHPDDLPALAEKWEALRDVNTARECEVRLRRSDGVFRWFSLRCEPLHDESRALVRWYGTAADIDILKQTDEKLREDERELRRITDAIPQTIVVLDPSGAPLYANQSTLDYTGLTAEDVLAPRFRERIFHPNDLERLWDERKAALARGLPFERVNPVIDCFSPHTFSSKFRNSSKFRILSSNPRLKNGQDRS